MSDTHARHGGMPFAFPPLRLAIFVLGLPVFALITGCWSKPPAPSCPSILIPPHFSLLLEPSLRQEGPTDVEVEFDGERETCTISVSKVSPAQDLGEVVRGPTTEANTTCKGLTISGIANDGGIVSLSTPVTKTEVKIKLARGGKVLGEGSFKPDYRPDECGFVQPNATLKLAL